MKPIHFLALGALAVGHLPAADVNIDGGASFQRIDGFGSSERVFDDPHVFDNFNPATARAATVMTPAQQDAVLDSLYLDLRLTRMRPASPETMPGVGIEPVNDNSDPNVIAPSGFDFSWKNLDAHIALLDRARQRGVDTWFISPLNRERWMNTSSATDAAEYAEWLLAQSLRCRDLGAALPFLSVSNEPSYSRNTMSGAFIRDVIKVLGPKLRAAGLNTLFVIPDDVRSSDAAAKSAIILADPVARSFVGALATHLYDEPISNLGQMKNLANQYGLPLWMTEFTLSLSGSAGLGNGPFDYADLMHELLATHDVGAIDYLWGYFGQWESRSQLVVLNYDRGGSEAYTGFTRSKEYYVTGQYSRFIRPGANRIGSVSNNPDIKVSAYSDGTRLTIVAFNRKTSGNEPLNISLAGLPAVASLAAVRTSGSENWADLPEVTSDGTSFQAILPHRSVTTFTADLAPAAASISLGAAGYSVSEGAGELTVEIKRTGDAGAAASVGFATIDGTAVAPDDYIAVTTVVNFAAGQSSVAVALPITADAVAEGEETFTIVLTNPSAPVPATQPVLGSPAQALVTILDDDVGSDPQQVTGSVTAGGVALAGARMTLFTADLAIFRELRSDSAGSFVFLNVPPGNYRLGVAMRDFDYQEIAITVAGSTVSRVFDLEAESHPGEWNFGGTIAPELLDGTGFGTLLPSSEVIFCHDTIDPIVIDPTTGVKWFPPGSGTPQGCHIMTLLARGDVYYGGGSMSGNPQDTVTQVSEYYRRTTNTWTRLADMNIGRWYPGLVRLPDERLLLIGGEIPPNGCNRTNTCEIYDPVSGNYTNTGSFNLPTEIPPVLMLNDGRIFKTWRYPEYYDIATGTWSPAPAMSQARAGAPGGDHCDHEIVHLPDGRVMAIGIDPADRGANSTMVEFFDPATNTWSPGPDIRFQRMRPETVLLPDGRVLAWGGEYTGDAADAPVLKTAGLVPKCTNVADVFDPTTNTWRPVADAGRWVHYHNVQILLPDGRVMNTGGAGGGSLFGNDNSIEYFSPPYLFRGVRPRIDAVSTTSLIPGGNVTLEVSRASAVTEVVLLGARASTHWVDSGVQRSIPLSFSQTGGTVTATLPADPRVALTGWYMLIVLVDDIPSEARMVRVTQGVAAAIPALPVVTISASGAPAETGGQGEFTLSRSGSAATPLTVRMRYAGTAAGGSDYAALPETVAFPAGSASVVLPVQPLADPFAEGAETVIATLDSRVHYSVSNPSSAQVVIADTPFDDWRFLRFGGDAGDATISGELADPDRDGVVNLLEYGLGMNPLLPSVMGLPSGGRAADGRLTLSFTRNPAATDLRFTVQVSDTVGNWTDGSIYQPSGDIPITGATTEITPPASPPGFTVVRDNNSAQSARFIRLKVNRL